MKIRFAVTPPAEVLTQNIFTEYLALTERLGFDTIWLSDIPLGALGDPLLSLTFAAACTTRLKLGANIVPLGRNPMLLAKQLAQLDRLSDGRLLLSFVPGLGQSVERAALGFAGGDRGDALNEVMALLRRWWSGHAVTATYRDARYDNVQVLPVPRQQPLEIWLGGIGPAALTRVAQLADGWLTAAATPPEAAAGRVSIFDQAREVGRTIDPEHFGISIPFAREAPDETALAPIRARRADRDLTDIVPSNEGALLDLVQRHIDGGLSKFVLRALASGATWQEDLRWLADTVLPLQT